MAMVKLKQTRLEPKLPEFSDFFEIILHDLCYKLRIEKQLGDL